MVVAVVPILVMKLPVHQVVSVITVRHGLVPAARAMPVLRAVSTIEAWRALVRVLAVHREAVLVHMVFVWMVQATVVQVVRMAFVQHRGVPTSGAMGVGVAFVNLVGHACLLAEMGKIPGAPCKFRTYKSKEPRDHAAALWCDSGEAPKVKSESRSSAESSGDLRQRPGSAPRAHPSAPGSRTPRPHRR